MIERLGNNAGKSFVTQIEPDKTESVSLPAQRQGLVKISDPVQEAKVAQTMKGDLALTGSLNMAVLGAQLSQPAIVGQTSPPVASTPPEVTAAGQPLKLNSKGPEVETLQNNLNTWRHENNLPEIQTTGVYTAETEQAVKDFQKASSLTESGILDESTKLRLQLEQSREYKALDPRIKGEVTSAYAALEKDPAGQKNLVELVRDAKFAYLASPDAQSSAIAGLMQGASSTHLLNVTKDLVLHAAILEKNENFKKLPEETKRAALSTMFYEPANGGLYVGNATNAVTELVTDPNFGKLTPKQQDQFLEIVRANPSTDTPLMLGSLMNDIKDMSPEVRERSIRIAHENAMNANVKGSWKENDQSFSALISMLEDSAFIQAPDDEKLAQLNGLSGRTGL